MDQREKRIKQCFSKEANLLEQLAGIRYEVEIGRYTDVLGRLRYLKTKVNSSNDEVKGVYHLVLARLNYRIGKLDEALALNNQAIALLLKSRSYETLQLAYCNHGFFLSVKKSHEAKKYLSKAEALQRKNIRTYRALLLSNKAFLALMEGNVDQASEWSDKALKEVNRRSPESAIDCYRVYILLASVAELKKDIESENKYLNLAKALAVKHQILDNWKQVSNSQSFNALERGDFESAYYFLREKDSINGVLPNRQISEFLLQMQLDEQLEVEKAEKKLLRNTLETKKRELLFFVGFVLILIAVLMVIFAQRYSIKKSRLMLMKQHVALASKTEQLLIQKNVKPELIEQLEKLVLEKEIYQNPTLTLDRLAKKLNTNRTYLSECINVNYQMNYSQWISGVRIGAAKKFLLDEKCANWSIEGISQTVGFSSISTFNATFKRETGLTPSQFRVLSKEFS